MEDAGDLPPVADVPSATGLSRFRTGLFLITVAGVMFAWIGFLSWSLLWLFGLV